MPVEHPLSPDGSTLAILDANALLPPRLSDILFDLFLEGLYHPRWTKAIESEFVNNFGRVVLAKTKGERKELKAAPPNPDHIAKANDRLRRFRSVVGPRFEVLLYDTPTCANKVPKTVNSGDVHVALAALILHGLSEEEACTDKVFIVTNNLAHLAVKDMEVIGVSVVSPGGFIDQLNNAAPARVEKALLRTINDLKAPPFTQADLLGLLAAHDAKKAANFYAEKWALRIPQRKPSR